MHLSCRNAGSDPVQELDRSFAAALGADLAVPGRGLPRVSWRHRLLSLLVPFLVGVIAALTWIPATLFNVFSRSHRNDVSSDIAYGDGPRRMLDVYKPKDVGDPAVIVFFYGGSWQSGAKETYKLLAATLVLRGYVVVVPDYRVYPEVGFPSFLTDGAQAIRWVKDNIVSFGGNPDRIIVMGHSAGAYIAAMLALDKQWLANVGLDSRRDISGLIGVSGPYDFLPLQDETLKIIFHGDNRPQTQPISFARGRKPPALLLTGALDRTVPPRNSVRLASKLRDENNTAVDLVYDYFSHVTILIAFAPVVSRLLPLLADIDAFVARIKPAPHHASPQPPAAQQEIRP